MEHDRNEAQVHGADGVSIPAFRRRLRAWMQEHTGPVTDPPADALERARTFQAALQEAGFAGLTWPRTYGGQGLDQAYQLAYEQEARRVDLPTGPLLVGLGMCGPTLLDLGTEAQKTRYVRRLLRGDEVWCQLFSEPAAGSDLAGLRTRAVPDGDGWVLTGQKVWTTGAQAADFGAVLARTDPGVPRHRGLTMFVLDMRLPGVTVRPLRDMSGRTLFTEVFLDDVRIPGDAVLGSVGGGWAAALTMLGHERVSVGSEVTPTSSPLTSASLAEAARRYGRLGDPLVRDALVGLSLQETALNLLTARLRQESDAGRPTGARGSVAKLAGALLTRAAVDVAGLVMGERGVGWPAEDEVADGVGVAILAAPGDGIAGGTNEIQRTIIGERILGLPREPDPHHGTPFRDVATDGVSVRRTVTLS